MSNEDRSAGRRTASLHCRPGRGRIVYMPDSSEMATWSTFPAVSDVNAGCGNRIVDVSGIQFCDGSYLGLGSSLDITSTDHIVMSARGFLGPNTSMIAPQIDILTAPSVPTGAYANMHIGPASDSEVFAILSSPDGTTSGPSIIMNKLFKTNTLRYNTAYVEMDGSAGIVTISRAEIPQIFASKFAPALSYKGDYYYEVTPGSPLLDVSANPILQDGQMLSIVNTETISGTVSVFGNFYGLDNGSGITNYPYVKISPCGNACFRGSLIKQKWVASNLWGAELSLTP